MSGTLRTIAAAVVVSLAASGLAHAAEEPSRAGYVERIEPICERNTEASQRILRGASKRIKQRRLAPAGRQFIRASEAFARGIRQIAAVQRPPADDARLRKWLKFLRIVKTRLRTVGKLLKADERLKATHESIRVERSSNAANNVGYAFEFRHCRLTRSRFQ